MEPVEGQPEIPLQSIVNEINNEGEVEVERKSVPVPVVKNPVYFYVLLRLGRRVTRSTSGSWRSWTKLPALRLWRSRLPLKRKKRTKIA